MKQKPKSAGKVVVLESSEVIAAETLQIENQIRQRAFEISQSRGHAGREIDDWLTAEAEVISVPPLELSEKDGMYLVQLAVAGIRADDVQVMATRDQLLVKAEVHHEHEEDRGTILQCEFKSAMVFRKVRFPTAIDLKGLRVFSEDGLLRIVAPLEDSAKGGEPLKARPAAKPQKARKKAS